jgi:hypothetical protein
VIPQASESWTDEQRGGSFLVRGVEVNLMGNGSVSRMVSSPATLSTDKPEGWNVEESKVGSEWGASGEGRGGALGHSTALLGVLRERFGPLPEEVLAGVWATSDTDRLRAWIRLAATAPNLQAFRSQAGV